MARALRELDPETVAVAALSHLATDPDELARFFALTGLGPDSLRQAAGEPAFIESLLDYILADDRLVQAVADAQRISPEEIVRVRARFAARRMGTAD